MSQSSRVINGPTFLADDTYHTPGTRGQPILIEGDLADDTYHLPGTRAQPILIEGESEHRFLTRWRTHRDRGKPFKIKTLVFGTFVETGALFEDEEEICICCKTNFKNDIVMVGCGHVCCERCAVKWYETDKNRTCICCRTEIVDTLHYRRLRLRRKLLEQLEDRLEKMLQGQWMPRAMSPALSSGTRKNPIGGGKKRKENGFEGETSRENTREGGKRRKINEFEGFEDETSKMYLSVGQILGDVCPLDSEEDSFVIERSRLAEKLEIVKMMASCFEGYVFARNIFLLDQNRISINIRLSEDINVLLGEIAKAGKTFIPQKIAEYHKKTQSVFKRFVENCDDEDIMNHFPSYEEKRKELKDELWAFINKYQRCPQFYEYGYPLC